MNRDSVVEKASPPRPHVKGPDADAALAIEDDILRGCYISISWVTSPVEEDTDKPAGDDADSM